MLPCCVRPPDEHQAKVHHMRHRKQNVMHLETHRLAVSSNSRPSHWLYRWAAVPTLSHSTIA